VTAAAERRVPEAREGTRECVMSQGPARGWPCVGRKSILFCFLEILVHLVRPMKSRFSSFHFFERQSLCTTGGGPTHFHFPFFFITRRVSRADGESDSGWGEEESGVGGTTVVEIEKKVVAKPGV
jgi:hypothetical protein